VAALLADKPDHWVIDVVELAAQALAQLETMRYDVLVVELDLPGASGLDVLGAAAQHDWPGMRILTGRATSFAVAAYALSSGGAQALLPKPYTCSALDDLIGVRAIGAVQRLEERTTR
jgi:DNA-binding NtrC family response regulator